MAGVLFCSITWCLCRCSDPSLTDFGCPRSVFVPPVDYNKLTVLDKKRQRNLPGHQTKNEKWVYSGFILAEPYLKPRQWTTAICSSLIFLRKTDPQRPVWNCCSPRQEGWGTVSGRGGESPAPVGAAHPPAAPTHVSFPINSSIIRIHFPSQSPGSYGKKPGIFREKVIRIRNS